ncbi:MAG TPA: hypothetical protein PKJ08_01400 [Candidatus Cloacimonadota bacterium]|nr:hypothetical protein [Candidatus Cloacimonadota bacterium]HPM00910.1 hypothetical protein [Candidatus Cloacimonadota bacterium]
MKRIFFVLSMLICLKLSAQPVNYVGPDFAQGFYDQYSKNFLNSDMAGRGHTGIALTGGADYGIHNPASMLDKYASLNMEFIVKGNIKEFNQYDNHKYQSPAPIGSLALTFKPLHNTHFGLSYSLVNSLKYYSFVRSIPQIGTTVDYQPTYENHQFTLTTSQEINEHLSVGINSILNMQNFGEYRNEGKVDLLRFRRYFFRLQPGILYQSQTFNAGLSYIHSADVDYKHKYVDYTMTIPSEIKAGVSINLPKEFFIMAETDYTMYSEQANYMKDQMILKLGTEKRFGNPFQIVGDYSLKAGFIYSPKIFEGSYHVPNYSAPDMSEFHYDFYAAIPSTGNIKTADMGLLTVGTSVRIKKDVELNIAYISAIMGDIKLNQFMTSLKFDLAVFNNLKK